MIELLAALAVFLIGGIVGHAVANLASAVRSSAEATSKTIAATSMLSERLTNALADLESARQQLDRHETDLSAIATQTDIRRT